MDFACQVCCMEQWSYNGHIKDGLICDAFCDFGACGGKTSSAENATLNDVNIF